MKRFEQLVAKRCNPLRSVARITIPVLTGAGAAGPHTNQCAGHPEVAVSAPRAPPLPNFAKGATIRG